MLARKKLTPVEAEKAKLTGEWRVGSVKRGGKQVDLADPKNVGETRHWQFTPYFIERKHPGQYNPEYASYQLDPEASPKRFDFIAGDQPDSPYFAGIYTLDGDKLTIAKAAVATKYGASAQNRPADFGDCAGSDAFIYVLDRVTQAQVLQKKQLDGKWKVERVTYDGDETRGSKIFGSHPVNFEENSVGLLYVNLQTHYTVDTSQTPKKIDLVSSPEGQSEVSDPAGGAPGSKPTKTIWNTPTPGIYKIEGDTLTWHFAAPDDNGKNTGRPTDFTPSKPGARHVLAVLKRVKPPAKADVAPAPPAKVAPVATSTAADAFTGRVQVNGRDATSGRVAVYFGRGQFAGSLLVNGRYSITGVPAGTHRVVVEGEVDGVRETTTASVEFKSGGVTKEFDLK